MADAVLYEGYVLYPYRASAAKNRCRWQFGVVVPRAHAEVAGGGDPFLVRAECVAQAPPGATVRALVRFLHVQARELEAFVESDGTTARPVPALEVGGAPVVAFDEAVACEVALPELVLASPQPRSAGGEGPRRFGEPEDDDESLLEVCSAPIELCGAEAEELLREPHGRAVGRLVRRRYPVRGHAQLRAKRWGEDGRFVTLAVEVRNDTDFASPGRPRDEVARHALVALHVLVSVLPGRFVSMVDPPGAAAKLVASCSNAGLWPVLVGREDRVVLAAPIILPDHAEVAPESPGDLFDATEIDELLALRVMTLTDEEKAEAVATDPRAAEVVGRCDALGADDLGRLHGAIRELRRLGPAPSEDPRGGPWGEPAFAEAEPGEASALVGGRVVRKGDKVRLCPARLQDAQDLFLSGRLATVQKVLVDVDGGVHVAVSVDDDPARDLDEWYGRYRYFRPWELKAAEHAP